MKRTNAFAVVAGAALAGLIIGGGIVASAQDNPSASPTAGGPAEAPKGHGKAPEWTFNARGESHGVFAQDDSADPDWIQVEVDGKRGYFRITDLKFPTDVTPEEALRNQRKHMDAKGNMVADLYAFDGVTILKHDVVVATFGSADVTQD